MYFKGLNQIMWRIRIFLIGTKEIRYKLRNYYKSNNNNNHIPSTPSFSYINFTHTFFSSTIICCYSSLFHFISSYFLFSLNTFSFSFQNQIVSFCFSQFLYIFLFFLKIKFNFFLLEKNEFIFFFSPKNQLIFFFPPKNQLIFFFLQKTELIFRSPLENQIGFFSSRHFQFTISKNCCQQENGKQGSKEEGKEGSDWKGFHFGSEGMVCLLTFYITQHKQTTVHYQEG